MYYFCLFLSKEDNHKRKRMIDEIYGNSRECFEKFNKGEFKLEK